MGYYYYDNLHLYYVDVHFIGDRYYFIYNIIYRLKVKVIVKKTHLVRLGTYSELGVKDFKREVVPNF